MLPIRDTVRSTNFPVINWVLIGLNGFVFLFELTLPLGRFDPFIRTFGLVPARLNLADPLALLAQPLQLITLVTHMFLHGGWLHVISNLWILFIFGDNVEDRMGSWRYLAFYLLSGMVAGLTQALVAPDSLVPAIGASGAIAGVLGAYLFMFPRSRVITLIPIFLIPWFIEIPAIFFLGIWFVSQLFSGINALGIPHAADMGGVAWWAHIGGFVFGVLVHRLFIPRRHPAYTREYPDEYWPW